MEPLNEANGYSSKNAFKGRLVFGVYGKESPKVGQASVSVNPRHAYKSVLLPFSFLSNKTDLL